MDISKLEFLLVTLLISLFFIMIGINLLCLIYR